MRTISASRMVEGSSPRPSRPAASSSSVKNGLPSLRAYRRSTSDGSAGPPRMSASCSVSSSCESGGSSMRRARGARSSSASSERRATEAIQERQQRLEDPGLGGVVALAGRQPVGPGELGQKAREPGPCGRAELVEYRVAVAREGSQGGDDRGVGELVLSERDAVSGDDARSSRERVAFQLLEQAGLAYARFTRDEGERWAPSRGVAKGRFELRELSRPSDEPAARHARGHGSSIARCRRCGHPTDGGCATG
jgi:hypothetical protein